MTRWARGGPANKKKPNEATPWSQMVPRDDKTNKDTDDKKPKHKKYREVPTQSTVERKVNPDDLIQFPPPKVKKVESDGGGLAAELEKLKQQLSDDGEKEELKAVIKKEVRREKRRVKRVEKRETGQICFSCRETGHDMTSCPNAKTRGPMDVCFKCGSTEHSINKCRLKLPQGEFPFAKCFICGEMGHLSKQCTDNPRGLYPNGGCCKMCGSVEHFKKDCPEMQKKQGVLAMKLPRLPSGKATGIEDQPSYEEDIRPPPAKKKKSKIVVF